MRRVAVLLVLVTACAPAQRLVRLVHDPARRLAERVTIVRDEWGIPHVRGVTDASVVFGLAWAQAEDDFAAIERVYIRVLGRAAEVEGEAGLAQDLVTAAFEVERLSREEYEREPDERRALWDAYAAGINYWLRMHPEVRPTLLQRFEPWWVLARFRSVSPGARVDGVRLGDVWVADSAGAPVRLPTAPAEPQLDEGSNAWAIAPERTRDGRALLFSNPHVGFLGDSRRYEAHLDSDEGLHVSGFAILGTPLIRSGHNERLAWTHTNTAADRADAYLVTFDNPDDALAYRFGDGRRHAHEWETELAVRTDAGMETRRYRFRRTHHGPLVRLPDGGLAAVRLARHEEGGSLQQWYAMGRARSLDEFMAALAMTALSISNTMYADADGNILFVQGNAVPRRDASFDWNRPVDGSDPSTEWDGYHTIEELPHLLNPAAGWLQNTNATPFLASGQGSNLERAAYPAYMAPEPDNPRAANSRRILESRSDWTLDALAGVAFDTRVPDADARTAEAILSWERMGGNEPERAMALDRAIELLREWDGVSTVASPAMTIHMMMTEALRRDTTGGAIGALERAVARLRADWDTVEVPWGDVNRLQRPLGDGDFQADSASLPVPGAPGWTGIIFAFTTMPEGRLRFGVSGSTWVNVTELAPAVTGRSVVTFGQSGHQGSPHWFDQAPLYARGELRPAWFTHEEVDAHATRAYRPGEEERDAGGG